MFITVKKGLGVSRLLFKVQGVKRERHVKATAIAQSHRSEDDFKGHGLNLSAHAMGWGAPAPQSSRDHGMSCPIWPGRIAFFLVLQLEKRNIQHFRMFTPKL